MNVDIKSKTDNKLLDRKEIDAVVTFDGATPSKNDLRQAICGKAGLNPDLVVLSEIHTGYGIQSVKVIAHAYENKESLMSVEPEHMKKRYGIGQPPKEEKKEEPKKEEAPKEKPKEEKKEEAKEEKKEAPKKEEKKE